MLNDFVKLIDKIVNISVKNQKAQDELIDVSEFFEDISNIKSCATIIIDINNFDLQFIGETKKCKCTLYVNGKDKVGTINFNAYVDNDILRVEIINKGSRTQGKLVLEGLECEELIITNDNGDVDLKKLTLHSIEVNNENGDISLSRSHFTECRLHNVNGDINVSLIDKCKLKLSTKNGDITKTGVKNFADSKILCKCSSVNGDIELKSKA